MQNVTVQKLNNIFILNTGLKRCIIILIIIQSWLGRLYGQSPTASVDSLVKYKVITNKDAPALKEELRENPQKPYRLVLLGGLESLILKNKFHIDSRKTGASWSFQIKQKLYKNSDSVNISLRLLLQNIKKAGLLTNRIYNHAEKDIDSGQYVVDLQLVSSLVEMSSRYESLSSDKLLPFTEGLYKNGIIDTPSFKKLKNDILSENLESASQLNSYCKLDRLFDLTKYPDDPKIWLEQIHRDIASMLPGLAFTDFKYTEIPDTSFSLPGVRFKISLVCNGRVYKHTSQAFNMFEARHGKITPQNIYMNDFHRIFNKILADQHSPLRFHFIMPGPDYNTDVHFNHFALIILNDVQAAVFMTKPYFSFMTISLENYNDALTSSKIDIAITGWKKMGLFSHLSNSQVDKGIDDVQSDDPFSTGSMLVHFTGVTYSLDSVLIAQDQPYVGLLKRLGQITHGAFSPAKIIQTKVKGGVKLQYLYKGKYHSYLFHSRVGWIDTDFPNFLKRVEIENNLVGKFYLLQHEDMVIYLTNRQHQYAVDNKLMKFSQKI